MAQFARFFRYMSRFLNRRPSNVFRLGASALALAIPFVSGEADSKPGVHRDEGEKTLFSYRGLNAQNEINKSSYLNYKIAQFNPFGDGDSSEKTSDLRVLISEVIIEGLDDHPEKERLEFAAYDAMRVRPGSSVTKEQLKLDLDAIYSTGWFSSVRLEPINGPLGVQILVEVQPNPLLTQIQFQPKKNKLPKSVIKRIFASDYGKTINLNSLQIRLKALKSWYVNEGYSLARISGPNRVTPDGLVQLNVVEGTVTGVDVQFLNKDGDVKDGDMKFIKGKTKPWVIKREISIKPGEVFNRNQLERDIKRLYATSLFSDVKVTLKPIPGEQGKVKIVLGITEQSTGSLSGGIGYSQSQGVFGQIGIQDTNLLGRAWSSTLNLTYGQYGGLANLTFADPWIKGDKHRTSFRTSIFLSREVPQVFRSADGGTIRSVTDYYDGNSVYAYDIGSSSHTKGKFDSINEAKASSPGNSWFDYEGDSVAIQRTGTNFSFARPLNGGDPYKKVPWSVLVGMNIQSVKAIDYAGESRPYGVATPNLKDGKAPDNDLICIAFNCSDQNNLFGIRAAATYNKLNDARNPTSGDYLTLATEQFISIGENSPTFNRARVSYTHFIPVNWLKLAKGCRPKRGEKLNCPQSIGFQVKAGTIVGELPPYEAFCLGGSSSVRGWSSCDLAVGRSFGEASIEYRFPIWNIVAGSVFVDGGSDLGSQSNVPGKPGKLLSKPGSGISPGAGLIVTTPVGPLRLEAASQDFDGEWRFNLGVGWKF